MLQYNSVELYSQDVIENPHNSAKTPGILYALFCVSFYRLLFRATTCNILSTIASPHN
jgi:hypothetical protein